MVSDPITVTTRLTRGDDRNREMVSDPIICYLGATAGGNSNTAGRTVIYRLTSSRTTC